MEPKRLLHRLDAIGQSLERDPRALALIGLGSVGVELHRLDAYSDLDFFVIAAPGHKHALIDDLAWLARVGPVAYAFRNTDDGYKLLFADGIFCEFAVFERAELDHISFADGRIVWKRAGFADAAARPAPGSAAPPKPAEWLVGEALTNLFVGLAREKRGEKLSATRFIQGYAMDRVLELAGLVEAPQGPTGDKFAAERRFEQRFPGLGAMAASWLQGYERNPESALAILDFLEAHFDVNEAMAQQIRRYAANDETNE